MKTVHAAAARVCECNEPSEAKALQRLLDASLDVICTFGADFRFLYASAAAAQVWGYQPEELIGKSYESFIHPHDLEPTRVIAASVIAGRNVTNLENRYIHKNGSVVHMLWSARWDSDDQVMYCVARDNNDKKALEKSYDEARQMFESFMNNSPMVSWITDEHCTMRYMNQHFLSTYGFTEQHIGHSIYDLFPSQIALEYHMNNMRVLSDGKAIQTVEQGLLPTGQEQILKIFKFPLQINGLRMIAGWAVDISEQMALQKELEKSLERYHYVSEATSDAIYDWDITANKIFCSNCFQTVFGYADNELTLKQRLSLIHPADLRTFKKAVFDTLRNEHLTNWTVEYRLRDGAGIYRHVVDRAFIMRNAGRAIRVIGAIQDITEQKNLQQKLMAQERKAKNDLVKSIVEAQEKERRHISVELHDNVNQMLTSCKLMLEYAMHNQEAAGSLTEKSYKSITAVIDEIRRISHDLNPSLIEDVGLVEAIDQMIEKINLSHKLKVHFQVRGTVGTCIGQGGKIGVYRIIQEQLNNIIKHAGASNVIIDLFLEEDLVNLNISDDGKGFETDKVKKGLGLKNIMHRVDYYNGKCDILSAPGKGCKMQITLRIGKE